MPEAQAPPSGLRPETASLQLQDLLSLFERYGGTDLAYLKHHFRRFVETLSEFDGTWDRSRGVRVLDVGAHWLHQAVLWRLAGYEVTAVDLPITFELENVRRCAEAEGIKLVPNADLERCPPLADLPDAGFNVVLFTEIIEHLTFNPAHLWREIHRLLAPGGRIVITTPNYYAWNGRAWDFKRFFSGFGGGITVDEILNTHTYGHHWREFAMHELIRYFCLLSPDFNTVKAKTMRNYYPPAAGRSAQFKQAIWEYIPGLRPNLHLEFELTSHRHGIIAKPSW
jgi:2-polyprenyl-6-hydroxyphenyl methylase/3-demethylubiquinone-9 3-methyltransferase